MKTTSKKDALIKTQRGSSVKAPAKMSKLTTHNAKKSLQQNKIQQAVKSTVTPKLLKVQKNKGKMSAQVSLMQKNCAKKMTGKTPLKVQK